MSTQSAATPSAAPAAAAGPAAAAPAADAKDAKAQAPAYAQHPEPGPGTTTTGPKGERLWHYFAIGSMINPVSLSLRNLNPSASWPGEVKDWELKFMGEGGMGTIWPKAGASLHGVLHVVTDAEMKALDQMEGGYDHVDVCVHLYDGATKNAVAYQFKADRVAAMAKHNPPGERYVDIISRGCQHYGVKQLWVDYLKTVPVTPRKHPKDFSTIAVPADATAVFTYADVAKCDGKGANDMMFVVNGKVLKWTGEKTGAGAGLTYEWLRNNVGGKDATLFWGRGLYEPRYPVARTLAEMVPEHRAWVEDIASGRMLANMTVVGRLKAGEEEAQAAAEKAKAAAELAAAEAKAKAAADANGTVDANCAGATKQN